MGESRGGIIGGGGGWELKEYIKERRKKGKKEMKRGFY